MTRFKSPLTPLFFLLIVITFLHVSFLNVAYAYEELNLTDIPYRVADTLNINLFPAQLLCSIIFMMICILPITIIARSKHASWIPELTVGLATMGFCIAIAWLPVWFILILSLLIALLFGTKMKDVITGK